MNIYRDHVPISYNQRYLLQSNLLIVGCSGNFEGTYGQIAVTEGSDVGAFNDQSLTDCQNWCVATAGCWSIGFFEQNGDPSFTNCYLKDTILTSLSSFVAGRLSTYYCTNASEVIEII